MKRLNPNAPQYFSVDTNLDAMLVAHVLHKEAGVVIGGNINPMNEALWDPAQHNILSVTGPQTLVFAHDRIEWYKTGRHDNAHYGDAKNALDHLLEQPLKLRAFEVHAVTADSFSIGCKTFTWDELDVLFCVPARNGSAIVAGVEWRVDTRGLHGHLEGISHVPWDFLDKIKALRPALPPPPVHNPDNLTPEQIGVQYGYRLLDDDEVDDKYDGTNMLKNIDRWNNTDSFWDCTGWRGSLKTYTYRTKLTREALAKLRGQ